MAYKILWADDEIELLKPHILFLEQKGYEITPVNSGADALEEIGQQYFDLVFLDENMPGMSGLEVLSQLKTTHANLPVVMITKSEEEEIMEEAIGAKITDYLIKPLNPNQILLSAKKILDNKRLVSEKTNKNYQQDFQQLAMNVMDANSHKEWAETYKKLIYWELEISNTAHQSMSEVLAAQKTEANDRFTDFIKDYYHDWLNNPEADRPLMSHQVLSKKVFPLLDENPVFLIVIDNLRYDQWKIIEPEVAELFSIKEESFYYSILPTTTEYARNALFGGMMPLDIHKKYPKLWEGEHSENGKNMHENELLGLNLKRNFKESKHSYHKILRAEEGKELLNKVKNLLNFDLNAIVYNFVDMMSHARTDMRMIKELAPDESAYRTITKAWFRHSSLYDLLKILSEKKVKLVITTDHGTINVTKPNKIIGDKSTNSNLRYKVGKNLNFNEKSVYFSRKPNELGLPSPDYTSTFVFAEPNDFFVYPKNFNHFARTYENSFQHGGVSMEEMIVPIITLGSKNAN